MNKLSKTFRDYGYYVEMEALELPPTTEEDKVAYKVINYAAYFYRIYFSAYPTIKDIVSACYPISVKCAVDEKASAELCSELVSWLWYELRERYK